MAFPAIPTGSQILATLNTTGGATKTFPNLSSLTKSSGDLLLAIIVEYDGNSTNAEFSSWGGSFTEVADLASATTMAVGVAWKISTGSETGTFTVTTADTSTNDSIMLLLAIPGAHATSAPEVSTLNVGTNAVPNAPILTPSWGAADTLWITVGANGETATGGTYTGVTASPTNYGNDFHAGITADVVGGIDTLLGFRQLNATSDTPGAFSGDSSNVRSSAITLAVRPATQNLALAIADDLGLSTAANLTRETFAIVSDSLGFTATTNLTRETFLQIADNLGFMATIDLTLEGGAASAITDLPPLPDVTSSGLGW